MKSAYELAMERFGSDAIQKVTDGQKKALADVEKRFEAKIAEARLAAADKIKRSVGDIAIRQQINNDLNVEIASLRERLESEKEKIRNGTA